MANARSEFRCLLGPKTIHRSSFDVHQTLLDFIRLEARLTGTKEGCAEGDCGACTVLVGRFHDGVLQYEPVNACIVPLASVDSTQILTVEHLADPEPHPVQQAMAHEHGSQCGFCTPGFLVASQALLNTNSNPSDAEIACAIEGNLCRCTGYQQIIESIQAAAAIHRGEAESARAASDPHPDPNPSGPEEPTMPPGHAR